MSYKTNTMKTLLIVYSFRGNNKKLAQALANGLNAEMIEIKEKKNRNVLTILLDVVFNRVPEIFELEKQPEDYEHLFFVAPVWFGKIASPLRSVFSTIKDKEITISLVSISAGNHGVNSNLSKELKQRTGLSPKWILNPLITSFFPSTQKPKASDLDQFRLSDIQAEKLANEFISSLKEC